MDLTIVVPTFNEGPNVVELLRRIGDAVDDRLIEVVFVDDSTDDWDDTFVWAAGEADSLVPLRRALRQRGLARAQYDIDGYWRTGVANLDHHAVPDDD